MGQLKLRIPVLKTLHWFASPVVKKLGYRWEVRRYGELKLGMLRKSLKSAGEVNRAGKLYPKRLVLLPGFGDTPLSWTALLGALHPFLKKNYDEVILFDFPGFGGFLSSEKCFPSMDSLLKSLTDVLESLRPHTLMGHSLGGWLAAFYASSCPRIERQQGDPLEYTGPEKLVLICPAGLFADAQVEERWNGIFRKVMEEGYHHMRPHVFKKEPVWFKWIVPEISAFVRREDVLEFMRSVRSDHNLLGRASAIESDVWLVWGEHDTLCESSWASEWMRALSRNSLVPHAMSGRTVLIKGAGHSPQVEAPATTAAVLAQILSDRVPHRLGSRWYRVICDRVDSRFYLRAIK